MDQIPFFVLSVFCIISGGGRGGGGVEANNIGCYISHEHPEVDVGFKVASKIMSESVDLLSGLEHKDSYPAFFVKANINKNYSVIAGNPTGLLLEGPMLYERYFNSKDDLECYKMVWKCTKLGPINNQKNPFIVSKYGVALKGRKEVDLCPTSAEAFKSCKVRTCAEHLCNDGNKSKVDPLLMGILFISFISFSSGFY